MWILGIGTRCRLPPRLLSAHLSLSTPRGEKGRLERTRSCAPLLSCWPMLDRTRPALGKTTDPALVTCIDSETALSTSRSRRSSEPQTKDETPRVRRRADASTHSESDVTRDPSLWHGPRPRRLGVPERDAFLYAPASKEKTVRQEMLLWDMYSVHPLTLSHFSSLSIRSRGRDGVSTPSWHIRSSLSAYY